jgi:cytochrome c biogenesis protein CcmG, thiol:disulfide interchange protein DsbE
MQRWQRLTDDRPPPSWQPLLKWLGIVLAIIVGYGYHLVSGRPEVTLVPRTPTVALTAPLDTVIVSAQSTAATQTQLSLGAVPPGFSLPLLHDPQTVSLAQFEGHPVLINFWASWCLPCREETPALEQAYLTYATRGVIILGVNSVEQDTREAAMAFVDEFRVTYPQLWDATDSTFQDYRVRGLPMSVLINREGQIEHVQYGVLTGAELDELLTQMVP